MKREEILKLFPGILDEEIKDLPNELVVCWYPSSGTGCDSETLYRGYGYNILDHWKQQPSNFKPNLFIFSDIDEFDLPKEAEVLFTKTYFEDPIITFLNNLDSIDYSLFPSDDNLFDSRYSSDMKRIYQLGLVSFDELIKNIENATSLIEKEKDKLILKILVDSGEVNKEKIIEERKNIEAHNLESGKYGSIKMVTFLKFLNTYFILVQGTNEYIYNRYVEEDIKIPLLSLNRPVDPFICLEKGINIKKLGIQEFIAGNRHVSYLTFGEECFKHPDFVFQTFGDENNYFEDIANLYSLKQS
jgi:hypothetical protein